MHLFNKITSLIFFTCFSLFSLAQNAPKPYGAIPTARQLAWQEKEMYVIMHFTPTTFQNKEWGFGDADPVIFNPTHFSERTRTESVCASGPYENIPSFRLFRN